MVDENSKHKEGTVMNSSLKLFGVIFLCVVLVVGLSFVPLHSALAQDAEGITIQKDVYLNSPIFAVEDLPAELTVSLYDAAGATAPIATQTFARGQYVMDFELSKSNGMEFGPIARLKVDFTNKLNLGDDPDNPTRVTEIWSELAVNSQPVGVRTRVSDETLVKLLLASDASIATYVTFAYEGDTNPLTTIYKSLPLASGQSATQFVSSLFSAVSTEDKSLGSLASPYWEQSGTSIYYSDGNVGIGTNAPERDFIVKYPSSQGALEWLPAITVANTKVSTGVDDYSFASFEFSANNGGVLGQFFADGSGLFLGGTPSVYFRATSNHPIILGTNNAVRMIITNTGSVGIGTTSPSYSLAVNGSIGCKELTVTSAGWADFVFQDNYKLPPLEAVEAFISENKHLPGIPSEKEVLSKGVNVGDMNTKLLQKIEELTLYMIELKKENDVLKSQMSYLQGQIQK